MLECWCIEVTKGFSFYYAAEPRLHTISKPRLWGGEKEQGANQIDVFKSLDLWGADH
jgi:hypothetical protein